MILTVHILTYHLSYLPILSRFNLTQLEEWCRTNQLNSDEILKPLDPIKEATQLLQVNKKSLDDVDSILSVCSTLNPLQVRLAEKMLP